jgi:aspartate/methionine/tyrosine aminotransferase
VYAPDPLGLPAAREAVAADYARRGDDVDPGHVVLAPSTSDAYSALFKVLCDPGDEVLVPCPSYPLFDHLLGLDALRGVPYALDEHGGWSLDLESIKGALSPRTRAVLLVSPNNPTGSYVAQDEFDRLLDVAQTHDVAVIADEVFVDYALDPMAAAGRARFVGARAGLVCVLGGLSKSVGLPQAKLAWTALAGSPELVGAASAKLELVCDTYLSVATPVQRAAPDLLQRGDEVRAQIQARVRANDATLRAMAARVATCRVLAAGGGWYGVLQVPSIWPEEVLVLDLLAAERVFVHPGYFFDFPREAFLVVSLLPPEPVFEEGLSRVLHYVARGER